MKKKHELPIMPPKGKRLEKPKSSSLSARTDLLCSLNNPEFRQCCCNCKWHVADYFHCTTLPIMRKSLADDGQGDRCICGIQKGWVCLAPEMERVYSDWPEHSIGCEMYLAKTNNTEEAK